MIVLGFDTATPDTVVALLVDTDGIPEIAAELVHTPGAGESPGHTRELLGLAGELLHEANLTWQAVDRIAVGVGPGTFTGLRIGVATARAVAQATGAQLAAVSTLEALATASGDGGRAVLACLDARRGEAFTAAWKDGAPLSEPAAMRPGDLGAVVAGDRWLAVGDGAVKFRAELEAAGAEVPPDDSSAHHVSALQVCRLARRAPAIAREDLVPHYVRAPDAVARPR